MIRQFQRRRELYPRLEQRKNDMDWQYLIDHPTLKQIHVTCVALSVSGFLLRATLMLRDSPLVYARWVRTLPHFVDTTLLLSGLWMAVNLQQYPGTASWLTAKLLALVAYVILGMFALRRGKTKRRRIIALGGALLCFAYMATVALTRTPFPGL